MNDYFPLKMKRKDLEEVNDEFSDYSLSSPATKIRRLDAEVDAEQVDIPIGIDQAVPEQSKGGLVIEELPENEERAIVLFKPKDTPLVQRSPSNFLISLSPDLLSGFRNKFVWSGQSNSRRPVEDEGSTEDKNADSGKGCLAVVPWMPSQIGSSSGAELAFQTDNSEMMMDSEEMEAANMDVEDGGIAMDQQTKDPGARMGVTDGLHHWQQQHCMIPQPPQNTVSPLFWYL